nr:alcohol dehydrogenase catalytic domain-containing protein [Paenibacillus larvae]
MVFGHEFCGIVEAVGEQVTNVQLGDYVSAEGHFACGLCRACRTGGARLPLYPKFWHHCTGLFCAIHGSPGKKHHSEFESFTTSNSLPAGPVGKCGSGGSFR